ncbi:MAG: hypothetical protein DMD81_20655, partial [Candidatus Rokuibacteriota bacterium]
MRLIATVEDPDAIRAILAAAAASRERADRAPPFAAALETSHAPDNADAPRPCHDRPPRLRQLPPTAAGKYLLRQLHAIAGGPIMRRFIYLFVAIVGLLAGVSPGDAATFTVDSTADAEDANPGDGVCATAAGACTLRAAIQEANALPGLDIIVLPAGTYVLTLGELEIQSDLVIDGAGANQTTVDGNHLGRVFSVTAGSTASILHVSIANGRDAPTLGAKGGGILNAGTLLVGQSVVRHSAAVALDGGNGGGVHNTGTLELVDSAVRDNSAGSESLATGGGIYNTGTLVLTHSTVHDNAVPVGPGTFSAGGGIESVGDLTLSGSTVRDNSGDSGGGIATNGTASILDSTVRDNSARNGGGIVNTGTLVLSGSTVSGNSVTNNLGGIGGGLVNTGSVSLVNSTISNNEVRGVLSATGGGISNSGTLTSTNSTIAGNAVKVDTPEGPSGVGGLFTNGGSATLENTIVAKSHGADCGPSGAVTSLGHNLDSDGTCGLSSAGDLSGADPLLGPLANNGGPTETHALKDGSPAIDAGDNVGCPATDQRGTARPQGAACDIGAFERADAAASADLVLVKAASANEVTVGDVLVYTLTVT